MKKNKIILLLFFVFISASAKEYKVKDMSEYKEVVKNLEPGDKIILSRGTWKDAQLVFSGTGSKENPIVLTVEEPGKTTLEGSSSLQMYGEYLVVDGLIFVNGAAPKGQVIEFRKGKELTANNSILRNCVIDKYNQPNRTDEDAWVNLWGRNNEVSNCYFGGKTNKGVTLIVWPNGEGHNENYHRIYRNYFAARPRLGSNGGETIRIGTSHYSLEKSGTIIEGNYFEHCNGEVEIVSVKSCENRIINNTFFECEGSVVLRHGNRNEVSGNYFIGNHKAATGGVRVINEGHKIYNNYFYALNGKDFRGPLVVMNGVPNSAPNRYHQVKNVDICFNTWVDCELPWQLCIGSDEERSAIPQNVRIADNVIYCKDESELVKSFDSTKGISLDNNLLIGNKGTESGNGFIKGSVETITKSDYPIVIANVKTKDNLDFVTTDINGNKRSTEKTIGAFENSDQSRVEIASAKNCGPAWYTPRKEIQSKPSIIKVKQGEDLLKAISKSKEGDVVELEGEMYEINQKISINHALTIRSAKDLLAKPTIKLVSGSKSNNIIEIGNTSHLVLQGIIFNGTRPESSVKYAISTIKEGILASYNLYIDNCEFANFDNIDGGAIYKSYKGTFADTLHVRNTIFRDSFRGFALNDEKDEKGLYNAEFITFENVVFKNIKQWAIDFLRGGNDESTLGGHLNINHCIFDNVANLEGQTMIKQTGLVYINIANSIFCNSPKVKFIARFSSKYHSISNCNIFETGKIEYKSIKPQNEGIIFANPQFKKNAYILDSKSPLKNKASDGHDIGLINWTGK